VVASGLSLERRPVVVETFAFYCAKHLIANAEAAGNLAPGFRPASPGPEPRPAPRSFPTNWLGQIVLHALFALAFFCPLSFRNAFLTPAQGPPNDEVSGSFNQNTAARRDR
jgi:hypothetical protein